MNRPERIVVVGAGLAGLRSAERLRELGFEGEVVIVGAEKSPPYHRPALSKQLLMGTMRPNDLMLPAYQDVNAKWRLNTPVQYLLPRTRTLHLPGKEELTYDGLIIATGVEARRQNDVPYEDPRIMVMRTMSDALALERAISSNRGPVAVVGGGFTGCEIAASLRHMGREVTLIGRSKNLLGNVLGQDLGEWLTDQHREHGVDLALGNSIKGWQPRPDGIALQLNDGSTMLAACVLLATGTVPSTAWLRGSGLPLDDGVVCEATCHVVGAEDVVACGDVAQWPNIRFDTVPRRIEHWLNAIEMGRAAAESLLAGRAAATPFTPMPRFWTEQYGVRIQAAGVPKLGKDIVALGSPEDGTGTVYGYARDSRLMGVVGVDCPSSIMSWTESIARQNPVPGQKQLAAASASATASATASDGERSQGTQRGFAAAAARKKAGRHSLPAKGNRREDQSQHADLLDPIEAAASARPQPAGADSLMRPDSGALVDTNGRPVEVTGRIGTIDEHGQLVPVGAGAPGPAESHGRMQPATNGHVVPMRPMAGGPADSHARMQPANGHVVPMRPIGGGPVDSPRMQPATNGRIIPPPPPGGPGPEGSYGRMPAAPLNGHLRAVDSPAGYPGAADSPGGYRGPADSPGVYRGPESSYSGMPPARPNGYHLGPESSYDQMPAVRPNGYPRGPESSYDQMPAVRPNGYHRGPESSYDQMPAVRPNDYPRGPESSYDQMPPVDRRVRSVDSPGAYPGSGGHSSDAYDRRELNGWGGPEGTGRHAAPDQRMGPADSYNAMPPARPGGHLGPVDSNGRIRPVRRNGQPVDSPNGHPVNGRQLGPEDSYDQFPPVRRGPLGPVDSNGRLRPVQTNGRRRH